MSNVSQTSERPAAVRTVPLNVLAIGAIFVALILVSISTLFVDSSAVPDGREEVVFWHFWGGEDRKVVEAIVDGFNRSQQRYFVRAIAMPGNNLDLKVFLAVTGGDPPDLINQDDPIIADWAARNALMPLDEVATPDTVERLREWMLPTAWRLGEYEDQLFAVCNGLDVRALYYDQTLLEEAGLELPETIEQFDRVVETLSVPDDAGGYERFGYLPDARRLWAWGVVFGGEFYDPRTRQITANDPGVVAALDWMASYRRRYGADRVASFRAGDQSLPGSIFPLLPIGDENLHGRYAFLLDGQWRVRELAQFVEDRAARGVPHARYGVMPLPAPAGGRDRAGWLNGNFFIIPRGAPRAEGAWRFIQYWIGFDSEAPDEAASRAAQHYLRGGWIPVSSRVIESPVYQGYLDDQPLFRTFVELAKSPNQFPIPLIPGAGFYDREIKKAGADAMYRPDAPSAQELLDAVDQRMQLQLDRILEHRERRTDGQVEP